jgi:hypothetical protein
MRPAEAIRLMEAHGLAAIRPFLRELVKAGMMAPNGVQYVGPAAEAPGRGVRALLVDPPGAPAKGKAKGDLSPASRLQTRR